MCDPELIGRLDTSVSVAEVHIAEAVSTVHAAVQRSVLAFGSSARAHAKTVEKLLQVRADELRDAMSTLQACLQYLSSAGMHVGQPGTEDSVAVVTELVNATIAMPVVSTLLLSTRGDVLARVKVSSRLVTTIDPARCKSSPAWLTLGGPNTVTITLCDAEDAPVSGITSADVGVTTDGALGWSVTSVSVEGSKLFVGVTLATDCDPSAVLRASIFDVNVSFHMKVRDWGLFQAPNSVIRMLNSPCVFKAFPDTSLTSLCVLQVTASLPAILAARFTCVRVGAMGGKVAPSAVRSLVASCSAALSSLEVAQQLCIAIVSICSGHLDSKDVNKVTCGAAGVIPAIAAAMSTHGAACAEVAANGCVALYWLADGNTAHADDIVSTSGGLDAILSAMASHPEDGELQERACEALGSVARAASPAAVGTMRASAAVDLLHTARRNHPGGPHQVVSFADRALTKLVGRAESSL